MKCACGSGLWTTIGAVVGLVAIGYGGYNVLTTGCPLGTCSESASASVVPASTADKAGEACHAEGEACTKTEGCTNDANAAKCPYEQAGEANCPHAGETDVQAKAPTKG
ncbi:MAG: hypothetical protein WAZ94_02705 [Phycisphaerales bacterium]